LSLLYLQQAFTVLITKFIKFGAVGFSGLFVDFGVTYLLKEKLRVQQYLSNAAGFMTAASTNYILNRVWTFQSTNPNVAFEYGEFILISLVGLVINTTILWLLVSKLRLNFYISKIIAIGIVTLWNFAANLAFTFNGV
jgi:putative flippase GtrA